MRYYFKDNGTEIGIKLEGNEVGFVDVSEDNSPIKMLRVEYSDGTTKLKLPTVPDNMILYK